MFLSFENVSYLILVHGRKKIFEFHHKNLEILVTWENICRKNEEGGLRVKNVRTF